MKNQKEVSEWLNRAFSNLERARFGKVSDSSYYDYKEALSIAEYVCNGVSEQLRFI